MRKDIMTAALAVLVLALLCGVVYPLVITGVSQVAFPGNANGQKIYVDGKLAGSKIIGQAFTDEVVKNGKARVDKNGNPVTVPDPRYFQSRPSATAPPNNAAASTFSNLGPNSKVLEQALASNIQSYLALERPYDPTLTKSQVPVDAVNTSASGLDPDISVANADIQAHRIAAVRHLSLSEVMSLISRYTHGRGLGFSGETGVNVLQLNLALDRATGGGR
jgi:potassium-transporting ATPase KdpC subunit